MSPNGVSQVAESYSGFTCPSRVPARYSPPWQTLQTVFKDKNPLKSCSCSCVRQLDFKLLGLTYVLPASPSPASVLKSLISIFHWPFLTTAMEESSHSCYCRNTKLL